MTRDLAAMRAACEAGYVSTADYVKERGMSGAKWTAVDEGDGNFAIRTRQGPIEVQIARVFDPSAVLRISAAAEMFEALNGMLRATDHWNDWEPGATERAAAQAALSKARGIS